MKYCYWGNVAVIISKNGEGYVSPFFSFSPYNRAWTANKYLIRCFDSAFKPLQFWQIDTKYIADQHAWARAGQKQFNTFVERSHRSDDEEFYAINLANVTSRTSFFKIAQNWILFFNYQRPYFGRDMKGITPIQALHASRMTINPAVGAMPVLLLDRVSLYLDYFWNISTIPWDNSPKNLIFVNKTMANYH
ncbi:hypothetical protein MOTE_21370 [Moorella thermoacetica]|uniref:Integrase catalytic domain-containing protein n=1 Tax=Neomoorella thermoacetica TaxID=1525 RepID=A0A1J5NJ24_NEOTH|nr:hypothetical protein MOTE_21370 [Moorella thermoacetica]